MATTCLTEQFKLDCFTANNCFNATQSGVSQTCSTTGTVTALASTANLAVGMAASGTNCPANTVIARILSATSIELSKASTGAFSSATYAGDSFLIALIKTSPSGTYDQTLLNYGTGSGAPTTVNIGTDEV